MAKDMHPPFSTAVVEVPDEAVDTMTAAGFTPVKRESKSTTRKASDKK